LLILPKGATSVEEAVGQFYDNPDKYSQRNLPDGEIRSKDPQLQVPPQVQVPVSPPSYAPPQAAPVRTTQQYRPHTNAVIEAGNIRARDEVRLISSCGCTLFRFWNIELTCYPLARDAEFAAKCSDSQSDL
jgi:hypothetical protein